MFSSFAAWRRHYQQIPSLREYLLVSQTEPLCERFSLLESGEWTVTSLVGLEAVLESRSVPVRILLSDLYAGVVFPPASSPP